MERQKKTKWSLPKKRENKRCAEIWCERADSYPNFKTEFGHLEGDTIVGENTQRRAVITLVERSPIAIITLKPMDGKASDIEASINQWLSQSSESSL